MTHLVWTRPKTDWKKDFEALEKNFAQKILHWPLTENLFFTDLITPEPFSYAVFTSAKAFQHVVSDVRLKNLLQNCRGIFCVGAKTAQVGLDLGLPCLYPSKAHGGEVLLKFIVEKVGLDMPGTRFWLPQGEIVAYNLATPLVQTGALVQQTRVYKTAMLAIDECVKTFLNLPHSDQTKFVFAFTSTLAAENFEKIISGIQLTDITKHICASLGTTTAQKLKNLAFSEHWTAANNPDIAHFSEQIFTRFF